MNISTVDYQGRVSAAEGDNQIFILDLLDLAADPSDSDYLAPDCDAVNQLLLFLVLKNSKALCLYYYTVNYRRKLDFMRVSGTFWRI